MLCDKWKSKRKPPDKTLYAQIGNENVEILFQPKATAMRWIILIIFMFLSVMNNITQFSFSPITELTRSYYKITELQLNALALVFMISGFTTRFVAMWLIDNKGLGTGVSELNFNMLSRNGNYVLLYNQIEKLEIDSNTIGCCLFSIQNSVMAILH